MNQKSDALKPSMKSSALLVDDSGGFRKQLKWIVIGLGYEVSEAENGDEAVRAVAASGFNIVIMNLNMPVLNGFEAARKIREMRQFDSMPILALSAYDSATAKKAAQQAGYNFYFNKLADIDRLISFLQQFIGQAC